MVIYLLGLLAYFISLTSASCANPRSLSEIPYVSKRTSASESLSIFINHAIPASLTNTFTDVFLSISLKDSNDFQVYQAHNCTGVIDQYEEGNRLFGLFQNLKSWRATNIFPFNDTYVGVSTSKDYEISIVKWNVNYLRVAIFAGGILLFLFANRLVRNAVFYYTSGCSVGLLAAVLLIAIIVYRVTPKKTIGIPFIIGGWSFAAYVLHFAWSNFASILQQYQEYVIGYFGLALIISFAICYKNGPPTDDRSHDIAQWTLQLLSIALIYLSTQIQKVSLTVIAILVAHQLTKSWLSNFLMALWKILAWLGRKLFPTSRRFLTEEEFQQQGRETTEKELEKLREYCKRPDVNTWKITHSVKNPKRLAEFIEGTADHISDDEQIEYDLDSDVLNRGMKVSQLGDEDDYDHEIVIRRRSRHKLNNVDDRSERSFLIPKGVSPEEIFQRISDSALQERKKTRIIGKMRHSLGPSELLLAPHSHKPTSHKSQSTHNHINRVKKVNRVSRSFVGNGYFSSDSEDQASYEKELFAKGEVFDFEQD